jgi:7-cyano-7-deazaguanine synthase
LNPGSSALLFSGGLDSAVLLALERRERQAVLPIHVRSGFAWEEAEATAIARLLALSPFAGRVEPVATLALDMRDVYPSHHWAVIGAAPAYDTPDEDVYLEGRNLTLLAKAAVLCARRGIDRIALGPLAGNPFPDARPEFFAAMSQALSLGLAHAIAIAAPLSSLHKQDVIRMGLELGVPLADTLSCMSPVGAQHCGQCSKCRERQQAFAAAGVADPTTYRAETPRTAST